MDQDQSSIVRRRLKEEKLDAQAVLDVLVQTLTARHVDCQLERTPGRLPTRGGQPRRNALVATQDALHELKLRRGQEDPEMARIQEILFGLLGECQFAAEKNAGLGGDDDGGSAGRMRIVRD